MSHILVLEDDFERVEALMKWCSEKGHTHEHYSEVNDFLKACEGTKADLIILDCDLGGLERGYSVVGGADKDGLTGEDAAKRMPTPKCPVLVWSWNTTAGPRMRDSLRAAGVLAYYDPFKVAKSYWRGLDCLVSRA